MLNNIIKKKRREENEKKINCRFIGSYDITFSAGLMLVEQRVEKASIRQRMEVSSLMVLPFQ